jgi:glycosyltransferase involved in cell wall biosynthesis
MSIMKNTPLNVLLISRCPPYPLHLGDRLIPYNLVRQFVKRGYQIDLLAFYQQPEDMADVPYYERYFRSVTLIKEPVRTPISLLSRAINSGRRFPTRKSQSWSPEMWEAIEELLHQRHQYDVVHLFGGIQVYEFRELLRSHPAVITPYESYSLLLERTLDRASSPQERLLLKMQLAMARRYESWMFSSYQRTVVVSDKDQTMLQRLSSGLPVDVIPNGVDLDKFVPTGHDPDKPGLLFTGNYDYGPNLDAAMGLIRDIFPPIKRAIPTAELMIVGANPPPVLRRIKASGVHVTGRVPDLRPYFESAMVYVSPLRIGAGIKNKILEALAMQTAVVATPLSCDGINVTPGKDVILARSNADIVRAVLELLQNPDQRQEIAMNGRKLIETHYTWQQVADQYAALYDTVIDEYEQHRW